MHYPCLDFIEMIDDDVETMFHDDQTFETYEKNQTDKLQMTHFVIFEIPSVVKTFNKLKTLVLTKCSLKAIDNLPANLVQLDLSYNKIEQVTSAMLPPLLEECNLKCNMISILQLGKMSSIKVLDLGENNLDVCTEFPPNVEILNVNLSNIKTTAVFANLGQLTELSIDMTDIKNIDGLSDKITILNASKLSLDEVGKLPEKLVKFCASSSDITKFNFSVFPPNLQYIDLSDNMLQVVPLFPDQVVDVDLTRNNIESITFPKQFKKIDLRCNCALKLSDEQKDFICKMKSLHNAVVKLDLRFTTTAPSLSVNTQQNTMLLFRDIYSYPKQESKHIYHEHRYIV